MNFHQTQHKSTIVSAILIAILLLTPFSRILALDKVGLEVQVKSPGGVASKGNTDTDTRFLEIKVTNRTSENLTDLVVKWVIFARDLGNDETKKAGSGDVKSSVAPMRAEKIETQSVTMTHTDAHMEKGKNSGSGKGSTGKKVKASGERLSGWGVQVMQDGKLVGEAYSRFELKKDM